MDVKRCGQDLMQETEITESGMQMVQKGVALCKSLVQPTEQIEFLLVKQRTSVTWVEIVEALQAAATPFMNLEKFFAELMALHKVYVKKTKPVKQLA